MNCSQWEEPIALYLGGDLPAAEAAGVERHLAECIACQVLASGLKETLALLKETHQKPIAEAHYAAVRARVLGELRSGRQRRWIWGFAAAAAALLLSVAVWYRPAKLRVIEIARPMPPRAPELISPPPKQEPLKLAAWPHHRRARPRALEAARSRAPEAPEPLKLAAQPQSPQRPEPAESITVRLETSDPDVIIYWITDPRGE
jgi:hypothetical protein